MLIFGIKMHTRISHHQPVIIFFVKSKNENQLIRFEVTSDVWLIIQQSVIDQVIDQWRVHLNACFKAKGKHFEHVP